jgi:hypothetical protein
VFNLALHGRGSEALWLKLIERYEDSIMKARFQSGPYHIFSLIGFMMRNNYHVINSEEEKPEETALRVKFEERLTVFVQKYKEFIT